MDPEVEQVVDLALVLNLDDLPPEMPFPSSGLGGRDDDGSEIITDLRFSLSNGGRLVLGEGAPDSAVLRQETGETVLLADQADYAAAVAALKLIIAPGITGTIAGQVSVTTAEANTPAGVVPASGSEPDPFDNSHTMESRFAVTVEGVDNGPPVASDVTVSVPYVEDLPPIFVEAVVDLYLLQDLSGSFADDLGNVRAAFASLVGMIEQGRLPNDTQLGLASFIDKPVSPFGEGVEYTFRNDLSLTTDYDTVLEILNSLSTLNGLDASEAQLEGLQELALRAGTLGFRDEAVKFIVLTTDNTFHREGDFAEAGPNDGVSDDDPLDEDYPSIAQVSAALAAAGIIPVFSVVEEQVALYQDLADQLGTGMVVTLSDNSDNLLEQILIAIQETIGNPPKIFEPGPSFAYDFQVGEDGIVADNLRGLDPEDGATSLFTVTSLPSDGVLMVDRGSDGVIDETFGPGFAEGPFTVESGDTIRYLLDEASVALAGRVPPSVTFDYTTTDSQGLTSAPARVTIDLADGPGAQTLAGLEGSQLIALADDGTADVLDYDALSEGWDGVFGFDVSSAASGGDSIDISDLLTGLPPAPTLPQLLAEGFLEVLDLDGNATLRVDPDGGGSFSELVTVLDRSAADLLNEDNILFA